MESLNADPRLPNPVFSTGKGAAVVFAIWTYSRRSLPFFLLLGLVFPAPAAVDEAPSLQEEFAITFGAQDWVLLGGARSPRQMIDMRHHAGGGSSLGLEAAPGEPAILARLLPGGLDEATVQVWVYDTVASPSATEVLLSAAVLSSVSFRGGAGSAADLVPQLRSDALRFVLDCTAESPSWELRQGERVVAELPVVSSSSNHWSRLSFERQDGQTRVWFRGELIAEGELWGGEWNTIAIVNPTGCDGPARVDDLLVHRGPSQVERQKDRHSSRARKRAREVRQGVTVRLGAESVSMQADQQLGVLGTQEVKEDGVGIHLGVGEFGQRRFGYGVDITFVPDVLATNFGMASLLGTFRPSAGPFFMEGGGGILLLSGGGADQAQESGSSTGVSGFLGLGIEGNIAARFSLGFRGTYRYYRLGAEQTLSSLGIGLFVGYYPGR